jgi:foldase protein PrsA
LLNRAVFSARATVLTGPVYSQYGWFVFEVVGIVPAEPVPIEEQREDARKILVQDAADELARQFLAGYFEKWHARTTCAPRYAWHPDCGNSPSGGE